MEGNIKLDSIYPNAVAEEFEQSNAALLNLIAKPMTITLSSKFTKTTSSSSMSSTSLSSSETNIGIQMEDIYPSETETLLVGNNENAIQVSEPNPEPNPEPKPEPNRSTEKSNSSNIPKMVFIVPYRDRIQQLQFFSRQMNYVLEDLDKTDYRILFIHQCDKREFNRGAMKNIGLLVIKELYPIHYQTITMVFNDIDTMPYTKNFLNYETTRGVVKHFYGYTFALGGIVSIKAGDFEHINGFPNFWAWGYEDNMLNNRVLRYGLRVDRSQFYPITDKNMLQFHDGLIRNVNRTEFDRYTSKTPEGWANIRGLKYNITDIQGVDKSFVEQSSMVNVTAFQTGTEEKPEQTIKHDLRKGNVPFKPPHPFTRAARMWKMKF